MAPASRSPSAIRTAVAPKRSASSKQGLGVRMPFSRESLALPARTVRRRGCILRRAQAARALPQGPESQARGGCFLHDHARQRVIGAALSRGSEGQKGIFIATRLTMWMISKRPSVACLSCRRRARRSWRRFDHCSAAHQDAAPRQAADSSDHCRRRGQNQCAGTRHNENRHCAEPASREIEGHAPEMSSAGRKYFA